MIRFGLAFVNAICSKAASAPGQTTSLEDSEESDLQFSRMRHLIAADGKG